MPNFERLSMKGSGIFFDSANLTELKKWYKTRILGGATTNPVILQKDGVFDIPTHIQNMINIVGDGFPISIEIPDSRWTIDQMTSLAVKYHNRFPNNAVIKIPMDPRDPEKAFEVIYKLGLEGVRINATVGLNVGQLIGAAESLRMSKADGDNYVSLFWGRRNEAKNQIIEKKIEEARLTGKDDWSEVKETNLRQQLQTVIPDAAVTLAMTLNYLNTHSSATRVIVGSVRSVEQIEQAFRVGSDIVTIPPQLICDWMYTQKGVETVDQFNEAYASAKDKITLI